MWSPSLHDQKYLSPPRDLARDRSWPRYAHAGLPRDDAVDRRPDRDRRARRGLVNVLGIETSCDETAAAVVTDGRRVRSNVIASQIALHRAHGGVVPELAARGHVTAIVPVVEAAMAEAGVDPDEIDAVAVTVGPGAGRRALVGVNVAKALAYGLGRPLVPVNHLEAHVYANWLTLPDPNDATRRSHRPRAFRSSACSSPAATAN